MGSAAAEGIPARFCGCDICKASRRLGGKNIRMTTSYALNERVRIDYGPDAWSEELKLGMDPSILTHLFYTHEHTDHLDVFPLDMRQQGFVHDCVVPLNIYGRATVLDRIRRSICPSAVKTLDLHLVRPFQPVSLPEEEMVFYPLPANHYHIPEEAVFYAVKHCGSWLMIANDTGIPPEAAWKWLEEVRPRFSVVIADCTIGVNDNRDHHMGGRFALEFHDRLVRLGLVGKETRYIVNHFSHNGRSLHSDLEAYFNPHGIEVGYDGMTVEYP